MNIAERLENSTTSAYSERALALVDTLRNVAKQVIMPRYLHALRERKADGSLMTQADVASQRALQSGLQALIDVPVLGEEMSSSEQLELWHNGQSGLWCVDPIDGTTNFINGIPFFAISVAYMVNGRTELAAVFNPACDEAFHAELGLGAWLNNTRLPLRQPPLELRDCVAGVDFKRISRHLGDQLATRPPYFSQRHFGSSALEWCYLAAGRLDVYLHGGQMLWDYAAGRLILEEAGGALCSLNHDDFDADELWKRSAVAATSPALLQTWRDWLRSHR